jgi:hypothetical protein
MSTCGSERAVHGQDRDAADIILEPGTRDQHTEKEREEEGGDSQQDQKEKMRQLFRSHVGYDFLVAIGLFVE